MLSLLHCGVTAAFAHITVTQAMIAFAEVTCSGAQPVGGHSWVTDTAG